MIGVFGITGKRSDHIIHLKVKKANGASLLLLVNIRVKLLLHQILHELRRSRYPVRSLCSADGNNDERQHDCEQDAEAGALEHLKVAKYEEEEHDPTHARVGRAEILIHLLEVNAVAIY